MRRKKSTRRSRAIDPIVVGWREWVGLPSLNIGAIKAKLDTGARTSALHAWNITTRDVDGQTWVRFVAHPKQRDETLVVHCDAPLIDHRWIMNSGGKRERRYVIGATLRVADEAWPIELSLTNRDELGFRMLIGREAMRRRLIVNPSASHVTGRPAAKKRKRKTKKTRPATAAHEEE